MTDEFCLTEKRTAVAMTTKMATKATQVLGLHPVKGNSPSNAVIREQLKKRKVERDVDVKELYLGDRELTEVTELGYFKNLQFLWLNGNKLRSVQCLSNNLRLSELYLQDNALVDVQGALGHLTCLTVLFLNNNQLRKLEKVIAELEKMQCLKTLNLFNNPLAQEPEYRQYVIHHIPTIQRLDRREVLKTEREASQKKYSQSEEGIKETIAFGRRSEGPPSLYYPGDLDPLQPTVPADYEVGNNFYRNNPPYDTEDQAVNVRAHNRSIMEYSSFDWSKVPNSVERRTAEKPFDNPQIITTKFR